MSRGKHAFQLVALGIFFLAPLLSAQIFSPGDPVLVKLHDYHAGTVVERSGTQYKVEIASSSSAARLLPPSQLIPLKKVWAIGDWILTDWTNERIFIRAQIVYAEAGRYLCVDWPQRAYLWRDYWTMVPLEYAVVLGQHFDGSLNYRKPEAARIASDLPASSQAPIPTPEPKASRLLRKNEQVEIEWRGQWYGGRLLDQKDDAYYVAYDGYSSSWNEWVGPERIRSAGAASAGAAPPAADKNAGPDAKPSPGRSADGTVQWKIGDSAWNTFTNEGKYYQVKLLAYDGKSWLCLEPKSMDADWKQPEDLHADKPKQTFFPGK